MKDNKKTMGAVKKEFKDALVRDYAVPINTFNAIRREKYDTVSRKVLFKLCFALELDYEDARKLLQSVGYDFRRNVKFEVVIESILKCDSPRRFIIGEIDATLERHNCSMLWGCLRCAGRTDSGCCWRRMPCRQRSRQNPY
jgi:hypothetical protein